MVKWKPKFRVFIEDVTYQMHFKGKQISMQVGSRLKILWPVLVSPPPHLLLWDEVSLESFIKGVGGGDPRVKSQIFELLVLGEKDEQKQRCAPIFYLACAAEAV